MPTPVMELKAHDDLDFGASDSFTVLGLFRTYDKTPAADAVLLAKKDNLTTSAGWALYNDTGGTARALIGDGAADDEDDCPALTENELFAAAGVRDVTADTVEGYTDGVGSGSAVTDTTTATLANAFPLRIGATSNAAGSHLNAEFYAAAIYDSALSGADQLTEKDRLLGIVASSDTAWNARGVAHIRRGARRLPVPRLAP